MTWVEKYRPVFFEDIRGQEEAIKKIKDFIGNFYLSKLTKMPKKALILHGSTGIGKTALAHVMAQETNSEIFELNASDLRNREKIKQILKPAIEQKSLTKNKKIILIDEADGISATDEGGLIEILYLIELANHPVIITVNDVWNRKLNPIRNKSELVKLKEIDYRTIKDVLIGILKKENLFVDNDVLTKISIKSKGDLRAAINDLQTFSKVKDYSEIEIDERNKEIDIFNAMRKIFKEKPTNETLKIFDSINMPIDEIMLWIEENIPAEYSNEELVKAYECLSKTDIFKGRIYKQQYWRFLIYENAFLSYGISASKKNFDFPRRGFTNYKKPSRVLKIWLNNQRIIIKKSIAKKYANIVHVGERRALREFPTLKEILKNPEIRKELKLNKDEIDYLDKPVE